MLKRVFDIVLSGIAMISLFPLMLPIMLALKLTGEGEVLFIQPRAGKGGKPFNMIKLATMLKESPNLPGGDITLPNDPRVLPFGRLLRKLKLNEFPQLWNIFRGDMSFVGWRPLTLDSFARYPTAIQELLVTMKPGLTGIGSLVFRDEESIKSTLGKSIHDCYYEDILPYKGKLEHWYSEHQGLWLDLKILFFTVWAIFLPRNKSYLKYFKKIPDWPFSLHKL
jgi:lipopolysaccharide/colanic/teichoic acid biosynthesis glycosyltransferase